MQPITPNEVVNLKKEQMPPEVIEAANELIAKNWNGHESTFSTDALADTIKAKFTAAGKTLKSGQITKEGWLDIEDIYRAQGWIVVFNKEGWNDPTPDTYTFKKK